MTDDLKACPFCGEVPAGIYTVENYSYINCRGCGYEYCTTAEEWNNRPIEDNLNMQLNAIRNYFAVEGDDIWKMIKNWEGDMPKPSSELIELRKENAILRKELAQCSDHLPYRVTRMP